MYTCTAVQCKLYSAYLREKTLLQHDCAAGWQADSSSKSQDIYLDNEKGMSLDPLKHSNYSTLCLHGLLACREMHPRILYSVGNHRMCWGSFRILKNVECKRQERHIPNSTGLMPCVQSPWSACFKATNMLSKDATTSEHYLGSLQAAHTHRHLEGISAATRFGESGVCEMAQNQFKMCLKFKFS